MDPTNIMCDFFHGDAASPRYQSSAKSTFMPLLQTWVMPERLENSTATFLDALLYTDDSGTAVAQMWLQIDPDDSHGLGGAQLLSFLVAACRAPLACPSQADVPIISGAAVLADDATSAVRQFHLVYPCVSGTNALLREVVHSWDGARLSVTRKRALLRVTGATAPYTATAVVNDAATAGVFILESGAYHRADAFHVRTDAAARQGLVPPVTVLQMRAPLPQRETYRSLQHGCLTESLVGFVVHETHRQRSIFSLAAVPSAGAQALYGAMDTVLEMSTAALHDADAALVPCCGLAQRLVYTDCALTRTLLHASPLLEVTQVVLRAHVEGALSRPTSLSSLSNVTWQLCGSQRYEATVIRLQRPLEERLSWVVEPLRAVSSDLRCVDSTLNRAGAKATAARRSSDADPRSQMRCVTCVAETHFSSFSLHGGRFTGGVSRRCSLTLSADAVCSVYPHHPRRTGGAHESRSCRRTSAAWWQPPPLWLSRTACFITHCSLFELSALYCLVLVVCCFVLLRRRGRGRDGLARRDCIAW
ncbi:conserved hypothetical protein [Leishmania major strain Friedlin]|uniref:Uncharacterized protein n=1 Tax=Leishmania major TaxID=5664 RepID=Q4Q9L2_LEIMA|nr:conserved hypothetical protein [Leishmania major strain Friedlin]CAG9575249.1 hypothetical_protein_-_conserved [Leishmania major strain Friedlin]CAJ05594.1 conserved hypothetical protein [Leishmania major strain Friedlin]|eukprot:XP_001683986.1 conserved hypothetical protein [Leishmania major strain Friedlin]